MTSNSVRIPIQNRSISKKSKIIKAGFDLICSKGYHNTNSAEIAKVAGVSTGIVYQYFKDKHDIFIEGMKIYANSIFFPMIVLPDNMEINNNNFDQILDDMILKFINNHKLSETAHEEITSMIHSDKEIADFFKQYELYISDKITKFLLKNNIKSDNLAEKVHISLNLIDNLCHEIIYHKHPNMDYEKMKEIVIKTITGLIL